MEDEQNLLKLIQQQKHLVERLETEYIQLEQRDISKENSALLDEKGEFIKNVQELQGKITEIKTENQGLKDALFSYTYNEKLKLVDNSEEKTNAYFRNLQEDQENRLLLVEQNTQKNFIQIKNTLNQYNVNEIDLIHDKVNDLSAEISRTLYKLKQNNNVSLRDLEVQAATEYEKLRKEPLTEQQIQDAAKKSNFESFVGLNILNKIGLLLIVVGVFAASQFAYYRLPNTLKGALIFLLGIGLLVGGEALSKKKADVFSLGLVAGGVSVLYLGLGISFFNLGILTMYPALFLCVLITAVSFLLSTRHNSQVVATFALIGGYLPLFSILENTNLLLGSMIYFLALNVLVLLLSFKKNWKITSLFGLIINIISTYFITYTILVSLPYTFPNPGTTVLVRGITLFYILLSFMIYTAVPLVSSKKSGEKFNLLDIGYLAVNTLFSSLIMYGALNISGLWQFKGILAIGFALIYIAVAKLVEKNFETEDHMISLFYLTALTFVVLIIPLQFGSEWLSMGWLLEGVAIATFGVVTNEKRFEKAGIVISALCLGSFLWYDVVLLQGALFTFKYTAMTIGSLVLLGGYLYSKRMLHRGVRIFQYITIGNIWLYAMYLIYGEFYYLFTSQRYNVDYLWTSLAIFVTFLLAYILPRIPFLKQKAVQFMSMGYYALGTIMALVLNTGFSPVVFRSGEGETGPFVVGTLLIVFMSILSLLAAYEIMKYLISHGKVDTTKIPIVISAYFLILLTQNLIVHFHLEFSSIILSIIYVVMALAWIVYGFQKQISFMRRVGLGMALVSVAKLFLIDLSTLTQGYRIISYFVLGITLVLISYVYQRFDRKLEQQWSVINDETKTD